LAGLHRTNLADAERGARNLSFMNLARIPKAFGISISELCEGVMLHDEGPMTHDE
jgi:hypothetical protein